MLAATIGVSIKRKYKDKLAESYFSIATHAGLAEGDEEYSAINVRFFNSQNTVTTTTKLLGLIPFGGSATGEAIHNMISRFYLQTVMIKFLKRIY